jgi:AcrR family transcriptional regulator
MPSTEPAPAAERPKRTRRRTGTYAAADERRRKIAETAVGHFAEFGYYNTSMPKIAADVGISHAGLLHHFSSKSDLLLAVLDTREAQAVAQFYSHLDPEAPDPLELLRLMSRHVGFNTTQPGLIQMYAVLSAEASNPDHPAHAHFRERYQQITGFITRTLQHGVSTGTLRADTPCDAVAREILAVADGYGVQFGLSDGGWDMAAANHDYLDRLARRITADGRGL